MLQVIIAFLATVVTAVQSLLLYTEGKAICFNNGCEIVENLTTVTPFYFNIAGTFFFFLIFWSFFLGRSGSEYWVRFARILLLAGLAAEAVLVFFQYAIAEVFCSYCLIILGFVVLLNVLSGVPQVFRGTLIFTSVILALFSLDFSAGGGVQGPLSDGAIAQIGPTKSQQVHYLFFSKSCVHCEKVIESLKREVNCSISFNPVEEIEGFSFPGSVPAAHYDPRINLGFLRSLSITEIPVLAVQGGEQMQVLQGGKKILHYLNQNCRDAQEGKSDVNYSDSRSGPEKGYAQFIGGASHGNDNCNVAEDCDEQQSIDGNTTNIQ